MTDANGLPLSLVVAGANTHDIKLVADTLDALQTGRPGRRLHLCMDKGYEAEWLEACLKNRRYEPHIQSRKEESEAIKSTDFKAHRWVRGENAQLDESLPSGVDSLGEESRKLCGNAVSYLRCHCLE